MSQFTENLIITKSIDNLQKELEILKMNNEKEILDLKNYLKSLIGNISLSPPSFEELNESLSKKYNKKESSFKIGQIWEDQEGARNLIILVNEDYILYLQENNSESWKGYLDGEHQVDFKFIKLSSNQSLDNFPIIPNLNYKLSISKNTSVTSIIGSQNQITMGNCQPMIDDIFDAKYIKKISDLRAKFEAEKEAEFIAEWTLDVFNTRRKIWNEYAMDCFNKKTHPQDFEFLRENGWTSNDLEKAKALLGIK